MNHHRKSSHHVCRLSGLCCLVRDNGAIGGVIGHFFTERQMADWLKRFGTAADFFAQIERMVSFFCKSATADSARVWKSGHDLRSGADQATSANASIRG